MSKKMTIVEQYESIVEKYADVLTEEEIAFLKERAELHAKKNGNRKPTAQQLKNKAIGVFGSYTWASSATKLFADYSLRIGLPLVSNVEIRQRGTEQNEDEIRMMADNIVHAIKLL